MKKDTYYFSHDYNARNDFKCLFLRQQLGIEGYGIYWFLIESLAESGGILPLKIIPVLAMQMQIQDIKVSAVINKFDLFEVTDNEFFSLRLNRHLQKRETLSIINSGKGKKSAEKRKLKEIAINTEQQYNNGSTAVQQQFNKGKESKENKNKVEYSSNNTHAQDFERIGLDIRKAYSDLPIEFTSRYTENFYISWLSINSYLDENCKFLRMWENQLTVSEYKKIFDRAEKKEFSILQAKQALTELDASRQAKDKYNSVFHGFNTFIRTILKNV